MLRSATALVLTVSVALDVQAAPVATDVDSRFEAFKLKFEKVYSTASEEAARRKIFAQNLVKIDKLNAAEKDAKYPPYGHLTPFMDESADEFRVRLGAIPTHHKPSSHPTPTKLSGEGRSSRRLHHHQQEMVGSDAGMSIYGYCPSPEYCSPMQNQGRCGDCWAFAATEVLETVTALHGGGLTRLSPQELVDCVSSPSGGHVNCQTGGQIEWGWGMGQQNGIETLSEYPISSTQSGQSGSCRAEQVSTGQVSSYGDAGAGDEQTMLNNYDDYGPLGVSVDASNWQFYDGGKTYRSAGDPGCTPITSCGTSTDHAVEIVGTYNTSVGVVNGWVIRNHWSTAWGCALNNEGGYALLAVGNMCGIATHPVMVASGSDRTAAATTPRTAKATIEDASGSKA